MKFSTSPYGMNGQFSGDIGHVQKALSLFVDPAQSFEIRTIFEGGGHPCVCADLDEGLAAVREGGSAKAIFWILNPVEPGCKSASKKTVLCRRWLLIDIDPTRPADVSATDAEKAAASLVVSSVLDYLTALGWPAPVINDSGNGWHLLYRVDLPNDNLSQQIIKSLLLALAEKFDTEAAHIDKATHDAPRPCKLPGTWARKGENTPDRPHRIARITYEPETVEPVTIEQLQAAIGAEVKLEPANGHEEPLRWSKYAGKPRGVEAYVKSAIERECFHVALATEGERNNVLNIAAFNLGTLADWPEMDEQEARATLIRSGERAGLQPRECLLTVASGWESGKKKPRERPQNKEQKATPGPGKFIIWANTIKPRKVDWLCPGRIPLGKMTTFAGQTGLGKTFTICDIAARVTTGREIPFGGGACYPRGKVLIISAEDDADDTIVPRFMSLGGDLSRLALLSPESEEQFSLAALDLLNSCIDDMGADVRMVAIDPPTSYLGRVDDHRNAELRGLLAPLRNWARDRNVALVFVTHVNKPGANKIEALSRVMGSVAWVAAVRSAHMFCPDPSQPTRNLYLPLKVNNAAKRKGLAYEIVPTTDDMATLRWLEEVDTSADDAMNQIMPRKSAGQSAVEWLMDRFREKPEWPSEDLKTLARDAGLSFNQTFKSPEVNALPINKKRRVDANGVSYFVWRAREGWPPPKQDETSERSESSTVSSDESSPY
jgi:hypothetical protein